MSFNQYLRHAARERRIEEIVRRQHLAPYTKRDEPAAYRESMKEAAQAERNRKLPRFDFQSIKNSRVMHPRVS